MRVDTPNLPVVQFRYQIWYRIMYRIRSICFALCQKHFVVSNLHHSEDGHEYEKILDYGH